MGKPIPYNNNFTVIYKRVSHIPQKASTGDTPLKAERPVNLSIKASSIISVEAYVLIKVLTLGASSRWYGFSMDMNTVGTVSTKMGTLAPIGMAHSMRMVV